ncbi:MAG TPA: ferrochelatase, partial [Anaeromyxobacter sp.]
MNRTAVFLMNLGGPRSLDEVEPYLYELFSDPLVVTAPFGPFRKPIARLISRTRAPSSAEKYALIGGKSPIVEGTEA